ncbi:hypothetical protein Y032_0175g500 [Ancylostoma ceylanicum]|uniref:Uncharacterized protein n=1 Tax=Ancylostoma ceylanicum TaxID=53326 RepID=A0A016SUD2_9BILA|nr:hypothetical protein Y032_0175g500 [Ancylostoma ceylanicum]
MTSLIYFKGLGIYNRSNHACSRRCFKATVIGALGPPVTPTCLTRMALSTSGPCIMVAVGVQTDGRDGRPECANQCHLATPLFPSHTSENEMA